MLTILKKIKKAIGLTILDKKEAIQMGDIVLVGCPKTRITHETFEEIIETYDKKPENDYLINLGNSNFGEENRYERRGYKIINRTRNMKNCSDKKKMFEILTSRGIDCLTYFDLDSHSDRESIRRCLRQGSEMCLRSKGKLFRIRTVQGFEHNYHRYRYATISERKRYEYRVVMLHNKVLTTFLKVPQEHTFMLKHRNCRFSRITLPREDDIYKICRQATQALGIDLCGIDVMVTVSGEAKIIEVNSGNGMMPATIKKILRTLRDEE